VGSLHSPVLMVEEGAKLEGRIAMQTVPSASGDDDSDQETK